MEVEICPYCWTLGMVTVRFPKMWLLQQELRNSPPSVRQSSVFKTRANHESYDFTEPWEQPRLTIHSTSSSRTDDIVQPSLQSQGKSSAFQYLHVRPKFDGFTLSPKLIYTAIMLRSK